MLRLFSIFFTLLFSVESFSKNIRTNELQIFNAPSWLKQVKVEAVTDKVQSKLEWKIRRVPVYWHSSLEAFSKAHSLGPLPAAVTIKSKKKTEVHIGPNVDQKTYERVLGHELVHVIFYQKYRGAIPRWLEEGFANHLSRKTKVDYKWLTKQSIPADVTLMGHPYKGSQKNIRLHYKISQALVEMLDKKCDLENLLRLSVKKRLTMYIKNSCEISDINQSFKAWVLQQSKA